jgi:hypothetical protein
MRKEYQRSEWKEFRETIWQLDNYCCTKCGRSRSNVVLQVHHKVYHKDRLPWNYSLNEVETLCKGCHAEIHGKIIPKSGWSFHMQDDLDDLSGTCEYCGKEIRYVCTITHENWGVLEVGTYCSDNLCGDTIASSDRESKERYKKRLSRFVTSSRWKLENEENSILHLGFECKVLKKGNEFKVLIDGHSSKTSFLSLDSAKEKIFEVTENGILIDHYKVKGWQLPNAVSKKLTKKSIEISNTNLKNKV